jgi:hypothetical protein
MRLRSTAAALLVAAFAAQAQLVPPEPDWREAPATPPALRTSGLIPLEIPGSALRFGVDPDSVSLGSDRVVRYVVVASSTSGTVNAMYEGIRCESGEFKVYARHNPDSGWTQATDSPWRSLHESPVSRHSLQVARNGACIGRGANRSAAQVVRDLRSSPNTRFRNEVRP